MDGFKLSQSKASWYTASFATLVITPVISFEPINVAKMMILSIGAFSLVPMIYILRADLLKGRLRIPLILLTVILIFSTISSFVSEGTFSSRFWGQFGRNNGLLTLICLSILTLSGALSNELIRKKALDALLFVSIPTSIYGGAQFFGLDPIPWSQEGIYSTLGNINFSSSFFAICSILALARVIFDWRTKHKNAVYLVYAIFLSSLSMATGSIQGPIMIVIGVTIIVFLRVWELKKFRKILGFALLAVTFPSLFLTIGFFGKGPFGKVLEQETILFRSDYWRAGLHMIFDSPLLGKGPDGYGDWYTRSRDLLAVERTGPERISNTAHNVFIDIGVGGGIFVLIAVSILVVVPIIYYAAKTLLDRGPEFSNSDKTIFVIVIVYFIQACISINQIGLAVWGWLFLGFLWAIVSQTEQSVIRSVKKGSNRKENSVGRKNSELIVKRYSLPPGLLMFRLVTLLTGFFISLPALQADISFASAMKTNSESAIVGASQALGTTQVHWENALSALRSLNSSMQLDFALNLVERFPSSAFAWRVIREQSSEPFRLRAENKLKALDPRNPKVLE